MGSGNRSQTEAISRVSGRVWTATPGSLTVVAVEGGVQESLVCFFKLGDTRAWLYVDGDYSWSRERLTKGGRRKQQSRVLRKPRGRDLEGGEKAKKTRVEVGRFVNLKVGKSGVFTQAARLSAD